MVLPISQSITYPSQGCGRTLSVPGSKGTRLRYQSIAGSIQTTANLVGQINLIAWLWTVGGILPEAETETTMHAEQRWVRNPHLWSATHRAQFV